MSADIDCAVFTAPHHGTWLNEWLARNRGMRRLNLTPVSLSPAEQQCGNGCAASDDIACAMPPVSVLQGACHTLYRYQACLMPVDPTTLSWVRTALSSLTGELPVPLLCITRDLKAEAVGDLFRFGLLDFIDHQASQDEIRARCTEVVKNLKRRHRVAAFHSTDGPATYSHVTMSGTPSTGVADDYAVYRSGVGARSQPALHLQSRCKSRASRLADNAGARTREQVMQTETSFRQAKQHVINHFEAQFLKTALAQHRGNVAGAARACAKHRRAFWALMRKHGIDANTFRKNHVTMPLG